MLARFSLYGFLKNQRYFEAFLVLVFLEKGLDFLHIGLLVAARELTVNVLELPSGAFADVCGRRRAMIFSFVAYIVSFLVLGLTQPFPLLVVGMVVYGIGDAFRTGTHKAMIFDWLRQQGREGERVRVYGYTRSWSMIGSAVSVVIAAAIVLVTDQYAAVFLLAIPPYVIGIINFLGYPSSLDRPRDTRTPIREVTRHAVHALRTAVQQRPLRRLVGESMGFDGLFGAAKGYLQPIVQAVSIAMLAGAVDDGFSSRQQTALLIGVIYVVLYLLSSAASRNAHRVAGRAGGEEDAARILWIASVVLYAVIAITAILGAAHPMIIAFVVLYVLHNLWRPILISRFDTYGRASHGASILSIESQATRFAIMILAPLIGWAVDAAGSRDDVASYWPLGLIGAGIACGFAIRACVSHAQHRPRAGG